MNSVLIKFRERVSTVFNRRISVVAKDVIAFDANDRYIALSTKKKPEMISIYDEDGDEDLLLEGHKTRTRFLSFVNDRLLVSAGNDRKVKIHDISEGHTVYKRRFDNSVKMAGYLVDNGSIVTVHMHKICIDKHVCPRTIDNLPIDLVHFAKGVAICFSDRILLIRDKDDRDEVRLKDVMRVRCYRGKLYVVDKHGNVFVLDRKPRKIAKIGLRIHPSDIAFYDDLAFVSYVNRIFLIDVLPPYYFKDVIGKLKIGGHIKELRALSNGALFALTLDSRLLKIDYELVSVLKSYDLLLENTGSNEQEINLRKFLEDPISYLKEAERNGSIGYVLEKLVEYGLLERGPDGSYLCKIAPKEAEYDFDEALKVFYLAIKSKLKAILYEYKRIFGREDGFLEVLSTLLEKDRMPPRFFTLSCRGTRLRLLAIL